jgi:hypothetical protein
VLQNDQSFWYFNRKGDEYREHGRNHFIQDQISEVFFLKGDPDEDEQDCPDHCPHKTTMLHFHCKWVSSIFLFLSNNLAF